MPGQCPDSNCPKNQKCVSKTTFDCECKSGFVLNSTNCVDYDECEGDSCNNESECVNTIGSFTCRITKVSTTKKTTTVATTTTTTTAAIKKDTILVLASEVDWGVTWISWKSAVLINAAGTIEDAGCLNIESPTQIEARWACSITWQDQFYLFGGSSQTTQISQLIGYKLQRVGTLDFAFLGGACSIVDDEIFLCFGYPDDSPHCTRCTKATSPLQFSTQNTGDTYSEVTRANEMHCLIRTPSSKGKLSPN